MIKNLNDKNVLIILTGALGDLARGLSLVGQLKQQYPDVRIYWLVEKKWQGFVQLSNEIDQVFIFDRSRGVFDLPRLFRELRAISFELTIDLQRIFKSGVFSLLSGAKTRLGFNRLDSKEFNYLFNNVHIPERGERFSKQLHYFEFLRFCGIQEPKFVPYLNHVKLPADSNVEWKAKLAADPIAVILGSSWESKDWPEEHYLNSLNVLTTKISTQFVLLGDRSRLAMSERISANFEESALLNLVGKTSLSELVAVLGLSRLAFGPDSGPGHIAAAVGTPFISIFGPTSVERTAPLNYKHLALAVNVPCGPCYQRACPGYASICMRLVTPEMLVRKVCSCLNLGQIDKIAS